VEHYFRSGSDASKVYGIQGVPHVMILDKSGKIVFKGHPSKRPNLEEDFDNLLKGVELTGEGTTSSAVDAKEGEEEKADDPKDTSVARDEVLSEMEATQAKVETLMKENTELKEAASKMARAFNVVVYIEEI